MACSSCATGDIREADNLAGRVEAIHGLPTYVCEPPDGAAPKGMVVFIPDAFGWTLPNNRVLVDTYARRTGCRVYLPDVNNGHAMAPSVNDDMNHIMYTPNGWWDLPGKV